MVTVRAASLRPMLEPRLAFAQIPAVHASCRATVIIPAHDEAAYIGRTLAALAAQTALDGAPLDPASFDVIVYANNCSDDTAAAVRDVARAHPACAIFVAQEWLPREIAHVGTARGAVMDAAALRFAERAATMRAPADASIGSGIIASTDADTIPHAMWLAWTVHEMRAADAVMGRILFDPAEWRALPAHTRRTLCEENEYQFTLARLVSQLAPTPHDPWPRHWQRWGPSFAVRADAYESVGGMPPVRVLEDFALYDALEAAGARIRHSLRVRVTTSARLDPRATGGFGTRIGAWNAMSATSLELLVEHPQDTLDRLLGNAARALSAARPRVPAAEATAVLRRAIKC